MQEGAFAGAKPTFDGLSSSSFLKPVTETFPFHEVICGARAQVGQGAFVTLSMEGTVYVSPHFKP